MTLSWKVVTFRKRDARGGSTGLQDAAKKLLRVFIWPMWTGVTLRTVITPMGDVWGFGQPVFWRPAATPLTVRRRRRSSCSRSAGSSGAGAARAAGGGRGRGEG